MSFRRHGNTDEQEEALGNIQEWAEKLKFRLHYGTSIGKSPQTVILDHKYQDGLIYVNDDGNIKVDDKEVWSFQTFKTAIDTYLKENPEGVS